MNSPFEIETKERRLVIEEEDSEGNDKGMALSGKYKNDDVDDQDTPPPPPPADDVDGVELHGVNGEVVDDDDNDVSDDGHEKIM